MKVSFCLLFCLLLTVSTFGQPWITPGIRTNKQVGPMWIQGGGLTVDGNITTGTGTLSAAYFVGDGSLLTGTSGGGLSKYDPGVFATNGTTIYGRSGAKWTNLLNHSFRDYNTAETAGVAYEVDSNEWRVYDLFGLTTVFMKYNFTSSDFTFPAKVIAGSFSGGAVSSSTHTNTGRLTSDTFSSVPGLVGDGVTDETAALQARLSLGGNVIIPNPAVGYLHGQLNVTNNTAITGIGGSPRFIFNNASNGYAFYCGTNKGIEFSHIELDGGSNVNFSTIPGRGNRGAIYVHPYGNTKIHDLDIHGFSTDAIMLTQPIGSGQLTNVLATNNTLISQTTIAYCHTGINLDDSKAEYQQCTGVFVKNCYKNFSVGSGNFNSVGCESLWGGYGYYIYGTNNNSHGNAVGCLINHNLYPIYATNTTYGFTFLGCQIWQGDVVLHTCQGIKIAEGNLDVQNICITNGGWNMITGNRANGSYSNNILTNASSTVFVGNRKFDGSLLWGPSWSSEATNIMSMRDPINATPMEIRLYNNAATEFGYMRWNSSIFFIGTQQIGGSDRDVGFTTANSPRYYLRAATGHLEPATDIKFNIGAATLQMSNVFSRAYTLGTNNAVAGALPLAAAPSAGAAYFWNSNGTVYLITSTKGSTAWAATNKLGGP